MGPSGGHGPQTAPSHPSLLASSSRLQSEKEMPILSLGLGLADLPGAAQLRVRHGPDLVRQGFHADEQHVGRRQCRALSAVVFDVVHGVFLVRIRDRLLIAFQRMEGEGRCHPDFGVAQRDARLHKQNHSELPIFSIFGGWHLFFLAPFLFLSFSNALHPRGDRPVAS